MAATFVHGKGTRVYAGRRSLYPILTNAEYTVSVEAPDVTTFGDGDKNYLGGGQREGDVTFDGIYDGGSTETQKLLEDALGTTGLIPISYGPAGDATGARARLANVIPVGFNVQDLASDAVAVAMTVKPTSRNDFGVFLKPEAAVTSTGSSTAVDNAAASTGGAVGHLHLVSASTLTALVVKIQHSTNGSAWTDLITFTSATAETVQRSTVSGTIRRYVRETRSTFTGGAGKTVTHVVAFARRSI